jgi:hypothetical protein
MGNMNGDKRSSRNMVGKPKGKRPQGSLGCRWINNTKRDLRVRGFGDTN